MKRRNRSTQSAVAQDRILFCQAWKALGAHTSGKREFQIALHAYADPARGHHCWRKGSSSVELVPPLESDSVYGGGTGPSSTFTKVRKIVAPV